MPFKTGAQDMKKILMATLACGLITALSGCANGGYGYGNSYGEYGGYGNAYGSYDGYSRGYSGYANSYQRDYREHTDLHRQLDDAHAQAHDEGINGYDDHADTHDALDAAHEQYHRQRGY